MADGRMWISVNVQKGARSAYAVYGVYGVWRVFMWLCGLVVWIGGVDWCIVSVSSSG